MSNSPARITDDELEEMQKRCNAATGGPWHSYVEGRDGFAFDNVITTGGEDIYLHGATPDDQDFVAHARQDVPRLLNEIRQLKAMLSKG